MKIRFISLFILLLISFVMIGCGDNEDEYINHYSQSVMKDDGNGFIYGIGNDNTSVLFAYQGDEQYVTVPETFEGYPLTTIANEAFKDKEVFEVILPDTVKEICMYAFAGSKIISFKTPKNLVTIGECAFEGCDGLDSFEFTDKIENIYSLAFADCFYLSGVIELPASVKEIGTNPFYNTSVAGIKVADKNKSFSSDGYALMDKKQKRLISLNGFTEKSYTVKDTIEEIEQFAFSDCKNLELVSIPKATKNIGFGAFAGCMNLKEIVVSPDNTSYISVGNELYSANRALLHTVLPTSSTTKFIPSSMTYQIADYAFECCYNLMEVDLSQSNIVYIGSHAFEKCTGLKRFTYSDKIQVIDDGTFEDCVSLEDVKFSESVAVIGARAFANCISLETAYLGNKLLSIGDEAFIECHSLRLVDFGNSIVEIGNFAFIYCDQLTSFVLPETCTKIGAYAFAFCESVGMFNAPESLIEVGDNAFLGLEDITIFFFTDGSYFEKYANAYGLYYHGRITESEE